MPDLPQWATIRGPFQLPSTDLEQAKAEFVARMAHPRNPQWDNPEAIARDYPDDIRMQLLSPFNVGLAMGGAAVKGGLTANQAADNALAREKFEFEKKQNEKAPVMTPYQQARIDSMFSPAVKSRQSLLESRIKHTRNLIASTPEALKSQWAPLIDSVLVDEAELEQLLAPKQAAQNWGVDPNSIPAGAPKSAQYPQSAAEADTLSMFGKLGERTPFAFSGGSAPPPVQAGRRRRWNVATGRLE
jgi:hypothetical protein